MAKVEPVQGPEVDRSFDTEHTEVEEEGSTGEVRGSSLEVGEMDGGEEGRAVSRSPTPSLHSSTSPSPSPPPPRHLPHLEVFQVRTVELDITNSVSEDEER